MLPAAYLDWNATAPLAPEARDAMVAALDLVGNPSSVHGPGRAARRLVEEAREAVAALVGAAPAGVVFTAGATEANATAIAGLGRSRVLASAAEHDSVLAARGPDGRAVETVPVGGDGRIDLDALAAALAADQAPALVSVMAVNNETGVIQPVAEAAAIARRHGALVHCDAVQAAGRIPLDLQEMDVDVLTLSAHKIGGPKGAGALVLAAVERDLAPLLRGGGQERRRRAGTENVAAIAGFGAAAALAAGRLATMPRLAARRDAVEAEIRGLCPEAPVWGAAAPRVGPVSCLGMPGVPAETQLMAFDLGGVAVSAGAACSSGKVAASHVLRAMGAGEAAAEAVRLSFGPTTTEAELERFVAVWGQLWQRKGGAARPGRAA
jgi:cysteine desulfurase